MDGADFALPCLSLDGRGRRGAGRAVDAFTGWHEQCVRAGACPRGPDRRPVSSSVNTSEDLPSSPPRPSSKRRRDHSAAGGLGLRAAPLAPHAPLPPEARQRNPEGGCGHQPRVSAQHRFLDATRPLTCHQRGSRRPEGVLPIDPGDRHLLRVDELGPEHATSSPDTRITCVWNRSARHVGRDPCRR